MEDLIKEYALGYAMLRDAIEGLTEEEFRFKPAPDKWSFHQILIHVTDSEISSTSRLKKVLVEDEPTLISFNQDAWANTWGMIYWTASSIYFCSNCCVPVCRQF